MEVYEDIVIIDVVHDDYWDNYLTKLADVTFLVVRNHTKNDARHFIFNVEDLELAQTTRKNIFSMRCS